MGGRPANHGEGLDGNAVRQIKRVFIVVGGKYPDGAFISFEGALRHREAMRVQFPKLDWVIYTFDLQE